MTNPIKPSHESKKKKKKERKKESKEIPDDSVRAATDRHDRTAVLCRDLEEVPKDVVLQKLTVVRRHRRKIAELTCRRTLSNVSHFQNLSLSLYENFKLSKLLKKSLSLSIRGFQALWKLVEEV